MKINLIILASTTLFCLLLAEFIIRYSISKPERLQRALFWSSPLYQLEQDGTVRYIENQTSREVMIYNNQVEYDNIISSNNVGAIDDIDYTPNTEPQEKSIAIVGDSFTVGEGAAPWVPKLRQQLLPILGDLRIYNFALGGAGVIHFHQTLKYYSKYFYFSDLVIIAISDDFHRLYWRPLVRDQEIRFCPEAENNEICFKRIPVSRIIDHDLPIAEVLAYNKQLEAAYDLSEQKARANTSLPVKLLSQSRFFSLLYQYIQNQPIFSVGEKKQTVSQGILNYVLGENLQALERILSDFPHAKVHLVHLPERRELASNKYLIDIKQELKDLGISYFPALDKCQWSKDMYLKHDAHPNHKGYENILNCVSNYLQDLY